MRKMPFLRITIFVIIGIYLAENIDLNVYFLLGALALLGVIKSIIVYFNKLASFKLIAPLSVLFFVFLGAFAQNIHELSFDKSHFSNSTSNYDNLIIKINSVKTGYFTKYIGNVEAICKSDSCVEVSGNILVKSFNDSFGVGDRIVISSQVESFIPQTNRYAFDEKMFYERKTIFHQTFSKEIILLEKSSSSINSFREVAFAKIRSLNVSETSQSVICAMLLGDKSDLGEVEQIFRKTGTSHVLAISGLHVGIIATIIFFLLSFMPTSLDKLKYFIVVGLIWIFCLLSGAMPSTIRSCIMLTCFLVGKSMGRTGLSYNYCFAAAFFMLLNQPGIIYDVGFQFSFSAILGILYFYEPIYKAIQFKGALNYCWQLISMSMAAQLMITPLALFYFHEFPLLFLITSLIAIPSTFLIIALSLAALVFDFPFLDFLMLDHLLNWLIESFLSLLSVFSTKDSFVLTHLFPTKVEVGLYYGLIFSISVFFKERLSRYLYVFICCFFGLIGYQFFINSSLSNSMMTIYAHEKNIMIDVLSGGSVIHLYEENNKASQSDWVAKNQRVKYRAMNRKDISFSNNKNCVLSIGNKKIGVVNETNVGQDLLCSDILLINTTIDSSQLKGYENEVIDFGGNTIPKSLINSQFFTHLN